MFRRPPDVVIGGDDDPYLERWWVIPRNRWFNIYLHHFLRDDDDRALHDHPWLNCSILLTGGYREHVPGRAIDRRRWWPVFRRAVASHRIELTHGQVWTLFITGPKIREWGFHCPQGWRHWTEFVAKTERGNMAGKGCGE